MSVPDLVGVVGVFLMVVAYAGAQIGRLEPREAPALLLNLVGAGLVLTSLLFKFNLAAFLMECVWGTMALYGLVRLLLKRR
ncbi:MAG: hypothetical protein WDM92_06800 [Caulobacteraceae bacterium]